MDPPLLIIMLLVILFQSLQCIAEVLDSRQQIATVDLTSTVAVLLYAYRFILLLLKTIVTR